MRKTILMGLLVVDLSGSMDQSLDTISKVQAAKSSIDLYLKAHVQTNNFAIITFGEHPKRGCEDISVYNKMVSKASKFITSLTPGPYGKTPLTKAIRKAGEIFDKKTNDRMLIVTDGSDTCNENPCEEVVKLDKQLQRWGGRLDLNVIGLGTTKDEGLKCFANLKRHLKNIKLGFFEVSDTQTLVSSLKEIQKTATFLPGVGRISINGASEKIEFIAKSSDAVTKETWNGEFIKELPAGSYLVQANVPGSLIKPVSIHSGEQINFIYSEFFPKASVPVNWELEGTMVRLVPDPLTQRAHRYIETLTIRESNLQEIPFGTWKVFFYHPEWLIPIDAETIELNPTEAKTLNVKSVFTNLNWFDVGNNNHHRALMVGSSKILVLPGMKSVPYLKSWEIKWLSN
jgi:hypothetical protein